MNRVEKKTQVVVSWDDVKTAFDRYLELPATEREAFLSTLGQKSPSLLAEVGALIKASDQDSSQINRVLVPALSQIAHGGEPVFAPHWLGKYFLVRLLGTGGMAEVYLALTHGPGDFERLVAVKRPLKSGNIETSILPLFEYEAQIAGSLNHPNIVHIYDFGQEEGEYLLVMEYIAGKNLSSVLKKFREIGRIPPPTVALYIVTQIANALEYAHNAVAPATGEHLNIIHRDISPKNILLSYQGDVKLFDFGIAKGKGREDLTVTGGLRGTVAYMAPETVSQGVIDRRSDLYSLCVVLYETLTGKHLFEDKNIGAVLAAIQESKIQKFLIQQSSLPHQVKTILSKGLMRDPEDRYQTARELEQDLQLALNELKGTNLKSSLSRFLTQVYKTEIKREKGELYSVLKNYRLGSTIVTSSGFNLKHPPSVTNSLTFAKPLSRGWRYGFGLGLSMIVAGIFLYLNLEKKPPQVKEMVQVKPMVTTCILKLQTEPSGADIYQNGRKLGISPTLFNGDCGMTTTFEFRLEGHETLIEELKMAPDLKAYNAPFKKLQPGTAKIWVNKDAKVFLNGKFVAEVQKDQKFELTLPSEVENELVFSNIKLGRKTKEIVNVKPRGTKTLFVNLKGEEN